MLSRILGTTLGVALVLSVLALNRVPTAVLLLKTLPLWLVVLTGLALVYAGLSRD
jgi:hypothetical protein